MKNIILVFLHICIANFAFGQHINFPKDSLKIGTQYISFYKSNTTDHSKQLLIALQGCYSDGNTFANETIGFAKQIGATLISIENKQQPFLNTPVIQQIIQKIEMENGTKYERICFLGFSCNGAAGIAYGLENDIRFKGVIAFMPAVDRVPFSYYRFSKNFPRMVIITGNKDFAYKPSKTMAEVLIKYNKNNILLIDIPGAQHDFNIPEKEAVLTKAYQFINKK